MAMDEKQLSALTEAGDMLKIIAEMIVGYRKTLVDGGVGADIADTMANDFHQVLLKQMTPNPDQIAEALLKARGRR